MTGGSSKSKGSNSSFSNSFDLIPAEFAALRPQFADFFQSALPQLQTLLQGFQNPADQPGGLDRFRTALTSGEFQGIDQLRNQAEGLSENEQLSQELIGQRLRGDFLDPNKNEALRDLIGFTTKNINQQFNDQDLERRSLFARAGQSLPQSSPFAVAQATGNQGRLDAIGESTAQAIFGTIEAERGRQTNAIEQARANSRGIFERSQASLQAQALPRLVDDLGIERGLQEFQSRLAALTQALGFGTGLVSPTVGVNAGSEGKTSSISKQGGISSIAYKHNVHDLGDATDKLMQLRPVTFTYNDDVPVDQGHRNRDRMGLIAEEVQPVFPDVIMERSGRVEGIYYDELVPVLISAVQALTTRVEELEEAQ